MCQGSPLSAKEVEYKKQKSMELRCVSHYSAKYCENIRLDAYVNFKYMKQHVNAMLIYFSWMACNPYSWKHVKKHSWKHTIPNILYALLDEYCRLIFSGKTIPWYLSIAMQVIVRMPVTMAVVCTKGTVLQTRTPAGSTERRYNEVLRNSKHAFKFKYTLTLLLDQRWIPSMSSTSSPSLEFNWIGWATTCDRTTQWFWIFRT